MSRSLARMGLADPLLALASRSLRRRPASRIPHSVGWHLCDVVDGTPRVARLRFGGRLLVDVRDYAHRYAYLFGTYEDDVTALLGTLRRPGWTVLDVGANVGYFALLAAHLGGARSRVFAFEPNPAMAALLRESILLNPGATIEVVPAACGDRGATTTLSVSTDRHNTGLSTIARALPTGAPIDVSMTRLDSFCADRALSPDLVKIDVEGAELAVLRGAEGLLAGDDPPAHVICEVWAQTRGEVLDWMATHGYAAHDILAGTALERARPSDAMWSNICFTHRSAGETMRHATASIEGVRSTAHRCPPDLRVIGALTRRAGLHLQPLGPTEDSAPRDSAIGRARHALLEGRGWTLRRPSAPDFDDDTVELIRRAGGQGSVAAEHVAAVAAATEHVVGARIEGAIVECSSEHPNGLAVAAEVLLGLAASQRTLVLVDTDGRHAARNPPLGSYPAESTRVVAIESAATELTADIALLLINTSGFAATTAALTQLYPRLGDGGIVLLGDCGRGSDQRRALDEYFGGRPPFLHRVDERSRLAVKP